MHYNRLPKLCLFLWENTINTISTISTISTINTISTISTISTINTINTASGFIEKTLGPVLDFWI